MIKEVPTTVYPEFNKALIKPFLCEQTDNLNIMVEVSNNRKTSQLSNCKTAEVLNTLAHNAQFSVLITAKESDYSKAAELKLY